MQPQPWIILASDKEFGAKTDCESGPLSSRPGYVAQCRGVNVAIVLGVVVFLLWIPISVVIVCGTIERGLWWWGEDDGWAQGETIVGGSNMMSEEEFDRKIGVGGSKQIKRRQTVHPESLTQQQDMVMIQQPKPAFVTPIASQFRSSSALGLDLEDGNGGDGDDDYTTFTPSSYRKHHQQRQRQQESRRLNRRGSNTSLSSRLSTFFGAGWNSGTMPLPDSEPPMPQIPSQYRQEGTSTPQQNHSSSNISGYSNTNSNKTNGRKENSPPRKKTEPKREVVPEPEPEGDESLHETASGRTQWEDPRDLIPMALYSSPHQPYQAHQSDNNMLGHHAQLSHGNSHPGPAVLIEHKHEHEYGSSKGHKDHGLFSLFQNKGYKNGRNGKNSISSLFQDKPRKDGKKDKDKDNDKDDRKDKFCKHGKESQDCKKCKDKEAEDEIIEEIILNLDFGHVYALGVAGPR
ncbi:hypothetical protein BGZ50_008212 [Haplosporangium sp. Z 11]|nr:hypothetical protein BGZ50_008212 [Haplosporangium sp. Z 11]